MDSANLQKASTKRASGEPGRRFFRKEPSSANQNLPVHPVDHGNLVKGVVGLDRNFRQVGKIHNLDAFRPVVSDPRIENSGGRVLRGFRHGSDLYIKPGTAEMKKLFNRPATES